VFRFEWTAGVSIVTHGGERTGGFNLTPQIVLNRSVADLTRDFGVQFDEGADDLDRYQAAFFRRSQRVCALIPA
jgi:hypothetical protein